MKAPGPDSAAPSVVALLGPTNTGKTHQAIERMLEHESGMMGLPLRLLAREVYDRVSTRVGEGAVALVTGEEKRVPAKPRYWISTTEAMPVERTAAFVAIDEIQLAAHRERGHVFTERLLHARGRDETWLLGAGTMRALVERLAPGVSHRSSPRLSELRWAGAKKLSEVPKRSAIVAFSIPRVFELAERVRERRGGAAVVLGAMSPRARNAQVAMFQSGEVDYVVATDAIGMGLNLAIDHVAFADTRKFDGREARALELAELGQIAGRAGRHTKNGTFGVLAPEPVFSANTVHALENHAFPRIEGLYYRSFDLDTSSVEALRATLATVPPDAALRRTDDAEDARALEGLLDRAAVRDRLDRRGAVALLWQVAQIPDFRKLLFEDHVSTLEKIFVELADHDRRIDPLKLENEFDQIAQPTRDIDELLARLARVRTWNYVANLDWVDPRSTVRERGVATEDDLSDRLQNALRERFVDARRSAPRPASESQRGEAPRAAGSKPDHPFAALRDRLQGPARAPLRPLLERVALAEDPALRLVADGSIAFEEVTVASLVRGRSMYEPMVRLTQEGSPSDRLRAERRLLAFSRDALRSLVESALPDVDALESAGRGAHFALSRGLGTAWMAELRDQYSALTDRELGLFRDAGVVFGDIVAYAPSHLKPKVVAQRGAFVRAFNGAPGPLPTGVEISARRIAMVPDAHYLAVGYPVLGPRPLRADIVERVAKRVREAPDAADQLPLASWLAMPAREAALALTALRERAWPPIRAEAATSKEP